MSWSPERPGEVKVEAPSNRGWKKGDYEENYNNQKKKHTKDDDGVTVLKSEGSTVWQNKQGLDVAFKSHQPNLDEDVHPGVASAYATFRVLCRSYGRCTKKEWFDAIGKDVDEILSILLDRLVQGQIGVKGFKSREERFDFLMDFISSREDGIYSSCSWCGVLASILMVGANWMSDSFPSGGSGLKKSIWNNLKGVQVKGKEDYVWLDFRRVCMD
ncbi:hypothetical protein Tco_0830840 [Tanacetum coccineum]